MTLLLIGLGIFGSVHAILHGDWSGAFWVQVGAWLMVFVWRVMCDAGNAVAGKLTRPQTNYNLTQNRFEVAESSSNDPTRPDEDYPAIIEIGRRKYTRIK